MTTSLRFAPVQLDAVTRWIGDWLDGSGDIDALHAAPLHSEKRRFFTWEDMAERFRAWRAAHPDDTRRST